MNHGLNVDVRHDAEASRLTLSGRFDHGTASVFGKALRPCLSKQGVEVVIDFADVAYIDSMALGSLLVYRERLASNGNKLVLANCTGPVRDAMHLANFQKIFEIR